MLLAYDPIRKQVLAGALVRGESEDETDYFLQALKDWVSHPINYVTIDFSNRLEAGVKKHFSEGQILKCAFHASQLLNRGFLKELIRIKNEKLLEPIREWNLLRSNSIEIEEKNRLKKQLQLKFNDTKIAWKIYMKIRGIFSLDQPHLVQEGFVKFFQNSLLKQWKGVKVLKKRYHEIITRHHFTKKGIVYIEQKVYKAWRAVIREFRKNIEKSKEDFNDIKYLLLMNPINMNNFQKYQIREYLRKFPWLRPYREVIRKFYYQFRVLPEKRQSLKFLLKIVSDKSHSWLKSAIDTLIKNEAQVFRFQLIYKKFPKLKNNKAFKVVNESSMKGINKLFRVQHGMRTVENIQMRISNYIKCPIMISSGLLEDLKNNL